eukprot:scaffold4750_cov140-Isochrysis_galbana.AAC.2
MDNGQGCPVEPPLACRATNKTQWPAARRAPCAGLSGPCTLRNNLENNPDAKYLPDLPTMTLRLALL